ncbi:MAG: rhomboid family intramembrane serine protease [Candidatus Omnitrophica bacterium]|nr:rhomboid family intramembrane serine protease [Candidatus Omnitrophota bacterium]
MSPYRTYTQFDPGYGITPGVKNLLIANVVVFLLSTIFAHFPWFRVFGLVPVLVFSRLMIWQFVTYLFLHGGLFHLLVNMMVLYFFGPGIEAAWGKREFLKFYFLTGVGAGLCSFLLAPGSGVPIVGASGAIFGLLAAYAVMFPETVVLVLFLFPMKIKYAVFLFIGLTLMALLGSPRGGIAHSAHLAGLGIGYLYVKQERFRFFAARIFSWNALKNRLRQWLGSGKDGHADRRREMDRILEKISREGMDSLTRRERKILEKESRE